MTERANLDSAVERILYPIIKLLIDCGVNYLHFARIARRMFVKVSAIKLEKEAKQAHDNAIEAKRRQLIKLERSDDEIEEALRHISHGAKVTSTSVALMSGVPRKDVNQLLHETVEDAGDDQWYHHRCANVLSNWWRTPEFTDNRGRPVTLYESAASAAEHGKSVSFEELVESVGKDLSYHAILDELVATNSVSVENGRIKVLKKRFERFGVGSEALATAANKIYALAEGVNFQLRHGDSESNMVETWAISLNTSAEKRAITMRSIKRQSEAYIESVQSILNRAADKNEKESTLHRVGVGVYTISGDEMAESELFAKHSGEVLKRSNEQ